MPKKAAYCCRYEPADAACRSTAARCHLAERPQLVERIEMGDMRSKNELPDVAQGAFSLQFFRTGKIRSREISATLSLNSA